MDTSAQRCYILHAMSVNYMNDFKNSLPASFASSTDDQFTLRVPSVIGQIVHRLPVTFAYEKAIPPSPIMIDET